VTAARDASNYDACKHEEREAYSAFVMFVACACTAPRRSRRKTARLHIVAKDHTFTPTSSMSRRTTSSKITLSSEDVPSSFAIDAYRHHQAGRPARRRLRSSSAPTSRQFPVLLQSHDGRRVQGHAGCP
jgi:hypothetical protein